MIFTSLVTNAVVNPIHLTNVNGVTTVSRVKRYANL